MENLYIFAVVPHAGTWIEILVASEHGQTACVVPHAGTWIEIPDEKSISEIFTSFPTRERGLKLFYLPLRWRNWY